MHETADALDFVNQGLRSVARRPEDATARDVQLLAYIAAGLNRHAAAATDELGALQQQMLPVAERVERCQQASFLLKAYLRPALRARAAAADTFVGARRLTALANSVGRQSAATLAHDDDVHPPTSSEEDTP